MADGLRVQVWVSFLGGTVGRWRRALPFPRVAPGPDPAGACPPAGCVEVVPPCVGRWPVSLWDTKADLFPDRKKPVSVELSLLPLEGSAAPAEASGKGPAPLWAEQLFPEATMA